MYVPEEGMKETLRAIAAESAPGSALLLEYLNRGGLEFLRKYPTGMIKNAFDWGEPFVFGVPDGQDREFFREAGLELGEALKIGSPESVKRYAMRAGWDLLRRASGESVSATARSRPEGDGRCGSAASRPGRCDVGLLAGRVGSPPAPYLTIVVVFRIAPDDEPDGDRAGGERLLASTGRGSGRRPARAGLRPVRCRFAVAAVRSRASPPRARGAVTCAPPAPRSSS